MAKQFLSSYHSPFGELHLKSDGESLTSLYFAESIAESCLFKGDSTIKSDFASLDSTDSTHGDFHSNFRGESPAFAESPLPVFTQTHTWLNAYFNGELPRFMPKIALPRTASPFRLLVWEILRDIPYGETAFYGEIARKLEQKLNITKMSAQAVGNAISKNPIAIIIPCHRVIGVKNIGGYSGGIARKIALLKHENIL